MYILQVVCNSKDEHSDQMIIDYITLCVNETLENFRRKIRGHGGSHHMGGWVDIIKSFINIHSLDEWRALISNNNELRERILRLAVLGYVLKTPTL